MALYSIPAIVFTSLLGLGLSATAPTAQLAPVGKAKKRFGKKKASGAKKAPGKKFPGKKASAKKAASKKTKGGLKKLNLTGKHVGPGPKTSPPKDPTPGNLKGNHKPTVPPSPVGGIKTDPDGDFGFTLSAKVPYVAFAGQLTAHYPRDWQTGSKGHGEVWISNQRLPQETYVEASVFVQPGYEYRVDVCTSSNSGENIFAEVGGTEYHFDAGIDNDDCELNLLLTSNTEGWTTVRVGYDHDGGGAFALDRIDVERTES